MHHKFLCPTHRQWLTSNLASAKNHYFDCIDTAQLYFELGHCSTALPYNGCAFETAEIVMCNDKECSIAATINFTQSALMLANTYYKMALFSERHEILLCAQNCLRVKLDRTNKECHLHPVIIDCFNALEIGVRNQKLIFPEEYNKGVQHHVPTTKHKQHYVH